MRVQSAEFYTFFLLIGVTYQIIILSCILCSRSRDINYFLLLNGSKLLFLLVFEFDELLARAL